MREGFKRFLAAFFAVLFVALGVALLCLQQQNLANAKRSMNWSSTQGVVLNTDYKRTSVGRRTSNAPYVTYRYQVGSRTFQSDVFSFGDQPVSDAVFEQYPTGRMVTVYFDPRNPHEATLVKGVGEWTITGLRYAQFILGISLAFLVYVVVTEIRRYRSS